MKIPTTTKKTKKKENVGEENFLFGSIVTCDFYLFVVTSISKFFNLPIWHAKTKFELELPGRSSYKL